MVYHVLRLIPRLSPGANGTDPPPASRARPDLF
jgi:hypothetical protein